MSFGLQKLATSLAVPLVPGIANGVQQSVQSFASLLSGLGGEEASSGTQLPDPAQLAETIRTGIEQHLKALGLPANTPLKIEVDRSGDLWLSAESIDRLSLEDAIDTDDELTANIRAFASQHSFAGENYTLHWPPA